MIVEEIDPVAGEKFEMQAIDEAKPLVDTGFLLNSVTWEVSGKEGVTKRKDTEHGDGSDVF